MDAINLIFNTIVGSILVVGAFGLAADFEAPAPTPSDSAAFVKRVEHPIPVDLADVCKMPLCGSITKPASTFIETKQIVTPPAPVVVPPARVTAPATANPPPAVEKHGDDHPATHSKRHKRVDDDRDRDSDRKELRAAAEKLLEQQRKALEEQQKLLEEQRKQMRKALERERDRDDDDRDDGRDEDDD